MGMDRRADDLQGGDIVKRSRCRGYVWRTREAFLDDPQVEIVGFQANCADLLLGLFLFNPLARGSTIAAPAELFRDPYDGFIYSKRATGTADCPEDCLRESERSVCPAECACAYVREILRIVRRWSKIPR
jgi:hypothetical protein